MNFIDLLKNEYLSVVFGGLSGLLVSWLSHKVINKRGVFRYYLTNNRIGISAQDSVFGNVEIRWNDVPNRNLFISTIELKNESLIDYENIIINTYTNNTKLLTEATHVLDSPNILNLTQAYKDKITVPTGEEPSEAQKNIFHGQREYNLPVFNRGQVVKFEYLNSAVTEEEPAIWLSATVKGVKVIFQPPQVIVFDVPRNKAAIYGAVIGLIALIPLTRYTNTAWIIGLIALIYGYFVIVPGAYFIKSVRKIRDIVGG
ncbi:hypothetical protein [Methylophilus sp. Leaf414]|uniref:hypothetical protein n=1 Tax=Methylophilus sp. Leaf414 TaxID=1736371 RepID=UPI00070013A9|nr:hypothetical protein [Methylophilus sp. Leaf414]KQT34067.1 hypothetical protein ASG24_09935 [Methylophilus sp. Leaf414]